MKARSPFLTAGVAASTLLAALAIWHTPAALAQLTDIANAPLASASNLAVKPNLMFILDGSGSMANDALPDIVGLYDGDPVSKNYHCKNNSSGWNYCQRGDPPFFDNDVNGLYYNPQNTYRPGVAFDGTAYPAQTSWGSVNCDPYNGWTCKQWYDANFSTVYDPTKNPVGNWYGTGNTFNVGTGFPEVVYCTSSAGDVNNPDQCRRNGQSNATDARQTGNPFRYTNATWRSGYPEMPAQHEFWRPSSGSTVTVTTSKNHGLSCSTYPCTPSSINPGNPYPTLSTFQIVPRTGTGTGGSNFDTCSGSTCTTTTSITKVTALNQFQYSLNSGQRLVSGGFNMIVAFQNGTGTSVKTVYVTAPNHGLNAGDRIKVYVSNTSIICTQGTEVVVLASPAPTANTFAYTDTGTCTKSNTQTATGFYQRSTLFNVAKLRTGPPFYYTVQPQEYCSDVALTDCIASTTSTTGFTYPAPLRYCLTAFDANRLDSFPKGTTNGHLDRTGAYPRCQRKFADTARGLYAGYVYPRYGKFQRTDINSGSTLSYTNRPFRTDCPSRPNCTGDLEMTNFSNWFAYYRNRMLMMKTSAGLAFSPLDNRYRVGFVTINPGNPVDSSKYLAIQDFEKDQKEKWYDTFYSQPPGGGTPLREALSRVGRHYAGQSGGINQGMPEDPVQYSCQQNFALLTTDGYWNGNSGQTIGGSSVGNQDNTYSACTASNPRGVCRPLWDGGSPYNPNTSDSKYSSSNTLADVAMYYWTTDLRPPGAKNLLGVDVSTDNVPTSTKDVANWQHMTTFALGLADGLLQWRSDYESAQTGDYYNIKIGGGTCPWDNNQCNWPMPHSDDPAALDDLWHAAVNGRGTYFNARDPVSLQDGLNSALTNLNERNASGAAAATSTPNVTPGDHTIFESYYTTVQWNGEVVARLIDVNNGDILPGQLWSAKTNLQGRVSATSDTRTIYMSNPGSPGGLSSFSYGNMNGTEQAWFDNKCTPLTTMSQCTLLDPASSPGLADANSGQNMVNFLRGQTGFEATVFRDRQFALGDTVNATPVFVSKPWFSFIDTGYTDFKNNNVARTPTLYVGANDGMLHAFNATTGDETWAYVPRAVMPNMWKLAEENYATKHQYYVDGSPQYMDVYDGAAWHTILVGGLNSGGRAYYALDITNPNAPRGLWNFCADSSLGCTTTDADLGLTYTPPIITKRAYDSRWVVLVNSGLNNVSPGSGQGYLYVLDALTGQLLDKVGTGTGTTTAPAGLGRMNALIEAFMADNTAKAAYMGDMQGYVWKFDLTTSPPKLLQLGQALKGGKPQPITSKPEIGLVKNIYKVVYVATGRYLGNSDLTDPGPTATWSYDNSVYAFKDLGTNYGDFRSPGNLLVQQTIANLSSTERTVSSNPVDWSTQNGWYADFNPGGSSPGERVNVDMQLVLGTLLVTTNVPGGGVCSMGGDAWNYQFDYLSGTYIATSPNKVVGRKLSGSLVVGSVTYQLPSGSVIQQVQLSDTTTKKLPPYFNTDVDNSRRSSWREITIDK